jgi:hypothetical protein
MLRRTGPPAWFSPSQFIPRPSSSARASSKIFVRRSCYHHHHRQRRVRYSSLRAPPKPCRTNTLSTRHTAFRTHRLIPLCDKGRTNNAPAQFWPPWHSHCHEISVQPATSLSCDLCFLEQTIGLYINTFPSTADILRN